MLRPLVPFLIALGLTSHASAQSYGLLVGGSYSDIYAAGRVFSTSAGGHVAMFMPFYINDRFVVRAEIGFSALRPKRLGPDAEGGNETQAVLTASLLCRYYAHRNLCFLGGSGWTQNMNELPVVVDGQQVLPAKTDVNLFLGMAYRFTGRVELGVRCGQGLLPVLDTGAWGTAHHRYASAGMSYLLATSKPALCQRRSWRSDLGSASRY